MKKTLLVVVMILSFFAINAQNINDTILNSYEKNNEIKLNIPLLFLGTFESSYERILNEKSSLGISGLYVFNTKNSDDDMNFSISPYYKRYLGKKYASGFFVEGFGMFSSIDGKKIYETDERLKYSEGSDVYDLSLGIGLGSKWVTKSGIIFEFNLGWGKLLFNADKTDHNQVARFGINIGYRF